MREISDDFRFLAPGYDILSFYEEDKPYMGDTGPVMDTVRLIGSTVPVSGLA